MAFSFQIMFNVTVIADACIDETSFFIGPLGIKDKLLVKVSTRCECTCDDPLVSNHAHCSGNGTVSCGICR